MPYRTLNPDQIIKTLKTLDRRISERFPGAGLTHVCSELLEVAEGTKARVEKISRPNMVIRLSVAGVLLAGLSLLGYVLTIIEVKAGSENLFGVLEGIDAAVNTLVVMGAGVYFLTSLESRWARESALKDLHELRSIVHVIDMHQLTKDPSKTSTVGTSTPSSPTRTMTPFELARYLDYCSELLSLAAKIAALYAQGTRDALVIETASDLGQITANMSGKIWQKITLIKTIESDVPGLAGMTPPVAEPSAPILPTAAPVSTA
ncbi:MAG: hypothetical protein AAFR75_05595 [Pseudomonadota bacterium]